MPSPTPPPPETGPIPVFDGHNDLLSCLHAAQDATGQSFVAGRAGALDLARCRAGGLAGGFFAIWVANPEDEIPGRGRMRRSFPPLDPERAARQTYEMAAILTRLASDHPQALRICRGGAEIDKARAEGAIAAILHLEGCEGIDPDLNGLHLLHAAGLRALGPVWSRDTIWGHGVPFDYPASPDTGPGLTEAGQRLVAACNRLGILIDLSHLNEAGFWDVARLSQAPLVATHSGAHAVTPATRNLTDRQLDAMAERGGLVGLNFAVQFLRPDGQRIDTGPEDMLRHLDHLLSRLGEGGVAFGSDFDGALMPGFVGDAAGLPRLIAALRAHGYGERLIRRLAWDNWRDLLGRTIG